jgi:hypothetical protein
LPLEEIASKAIGGPAGPPFFVRGLISAVPAVNVRAMKTGIILINRCIITC